MSGKFRCAVVSVLSVMHVQRNQKVTALAGLPEEFIDRGVARRLDHVVADAVSLCGGDDLFIVRIEHHLPLGVHQTLVRGAGRCGRLTVV